MATLLSMVQAIHMGLIMSLLVPNHACFQPGTALRSASSPPDSIWNHYLTLEALIIINYG